MVMNATVFPNPIFRLSFVVALSLALCPCATSENQDAALEKESFVAKSFLRTYVGCEAPLLEDLGKKYWPKYNMHLREFRFEKHIVRASENMVISYGLMGPRIRPDALLAPDKEMTKEQMFSRLARLLQYFDLPPSIDKYEILAPKDPDEFAWEVRLPYNVNGTPVRKVDAFYASIMEWEATPRHVSVHGPVTPSNDPKEVVNAESAVSVARDFLSRFFKVTPEEVFPNFSKHLSVQRVISSDQDCLWGDCFGGGDEVKYYYCWEVKYVSPGEEKGVSILVRMDNGNIIAGEDARPHF